MTSRPAEAKVARCHFPPRCIYERRRCSDPVHENNRPSLQRGRRHGINHPPTIVENLHTVPVAGVGKEFLKRFVGVAEDEGHVDRNRTCIVRLDLFSKNFSRNWRSPDSASLVKVPSVCLTSRLATLLRNRLSTEVRTKCSTEPENQGSCISLRFPLPNSIPASSIEHPPAICRRSILHLFRIRRSDQGSTRRNQPTQNFQIPAPRLHPVRSGREIALNASQSSAGKWIQCNGHG